MSDNWDQVSPEVMEHMRFYIDANGEDSEVMTDAEVLNRVDETFVGGAAQMNRELHGEGRSEWYRENPV